MKKLALLLSALTLNATAAHALTPITTGAMFLCPGVESFNLAGTELQGTGFEFVGDQTNEILYQTNALPNPMPTDFSKYSPTGIDYDSTRGLLTCNYHSSNSSQSPITLNYTLANGLGGSIVLQDNDSIILIFPIGLR